MHAASAAHKRAIHIHIMDSMAPAAHLVSPWLKLPPAALWAASLSSCTRLVVAALERASTASSKSRPSVMTFQFLRTSILDNRAATSVNI